MAEHHRKDKDGHREYMRQRAAKARLDWANEIVEIKSRSGCVTCGERDHRCLVFHHRNPAEKKFQVQWNAWSRTRKSRDEELAKCDVMCANCHHKLHYERIDLRK